MVGEFTANKEAISVKFDKQMLKWETVIYIVLLFSKNWHTVNESVKETCICFAHWEIVDKLWQLEQLHSFIFKTAERGTLSFLRELTFNSGDVRCRGGQVLKVDKLILTSVVPTEHQENVFYLVEEWRPLVYRTELGASRP